MAAPPAPTRSEPSPERMSTPPSTLADTLTSSSEDSLSIRALWVFCDPAAPPPPAFSLTIDWFSWEICESRLFTWLTLSEIWLSAWTDSCCSCEEIDEDWLRKVWTSATTWSRGTLEAGFCTAEVRSAKVCSS